MQRSAAKCSGGGVARCAYALKELPLAFLASRSSSLKMKHSRRWLVVVPLTVPLHPAHLHFEGTQLVSAGADGLIKLWGVRMSGEGAGRG